MFQKSHIIMLGLLCLPFHSHLPQDPELLAIEQLLSRPDEEIDLLDALLQIESIVDPGLNKAKMKKQFDRLYETILEESEHPDGDLRGLTKVLYDEGPWNQFRAFTYDLEDPFGKNFRNPMISNFLETRKGNCVSMPVLYYLLARKMGYRLFLANAPRHLFIIGYDGEGQVGIEATRRGISQPMAEFESQWKLSDLAKRNQLYFRPISHKEMIVSNLVLLVEHFRKSDDYRRAIWVLNMVLEHNPNDGFGLIYKHQIYQEIHRKKIYIPEIYQDKTPDKKHYFQYVWLQALSAKFLWQQLGYQDFSDEEYQVIIDRVQRIKEGKERV